MSEAQKVNVQKDIRKQLKAALASVSEHHAHLVANAKTRVDIYPAPFLNRYRIYRVEHLNPYKPDIFYVGFAPRMPAYLLTAYPESYIALAQKDNVSIDSPETAISYVTVYVEVTRSMSSLTYLVRSMDEMRFLHNMTQEEERLKAAFIEKYRSVITPPAAKPTASGYEVIAFTVTQQTLTRHTFEVSFAGEIEDDARVLEHDLPLVFGL
jgi:hypothetical protein